MDHPLPQLHRATSVLTPKASDVYEGIKDTFKKPGDFYNREAPDPMISFIIGIVLCVVTAVYWYLRRWHIVRKSHKDQHVSNSLTLRTLISTLADNDDPAFTILRVASQSMLFLGGFQLDYQLTFAVMLGILRFSVTLGFDSCNSFTQRSRNPSRPCYCFQARQEILYPKPKIGWEWTLVVEVGNNECLRRHLA